MSISVETYTDFLISLGFSKEKAEELEPSLRETSSALASAFSMTMEEATKMLVRARGLVRKKSALKDIYKLKEGLEQSRCLQTVGESLVGITLQELEKFLLNKTIFTESYIEKNKNFLSFLELTKLPFNLDTMVKYIEHSGIKKQYITPATVRNRKFQMKRICRELINANPEKWTALDEFKLEAFFKRLKTGSRQSWTVPREKILTWDEIEDLLHGAPYSWKLILLFLATTGVRVSELVAIIRPRCREVRDKVEITVMGKGSKQRTIACSTGLYQDICVEFPSRYLLFCTSKGTAFTRQHIWRGCNRLGYEILGRPVGVHTFRHSFATQMIEKGVELKRVSDYLGHTKTSTTSDMYVHLDSIGIKDLPTFGNY